MGAAVASSLSHGLAWKDVIDIAGAAVNDLATLRALYDRLATNSSGNTIPPAALTNFRCPVDIYIVHDTPYAVQAAALQRLSSLLAGLGLVTSLSSATADYRHGIENATLVLFFITQPYVDRIATKTAQHDRAVREFQYIAARKSFLRLVPVLLGDDVDLSHDSAGPVGLLLGGRSNVRYCGMKDPPHCNFLIHRLWLLLSRCHLLAGHLLARGNQRHRRRRPQPRCHYPVPRMRARLHRQRSEVIQLVAGSSLRYAAHQHPPYPSFYQNRAVKLQEMTRWMRLKTPGIHPAKWPGALPYLPWLPHVSTAVPVLPLVLVHPLLTSFPPS